MEVTDRPSHEEAATVVDVVRNDRCTDEGDIDSASAGPSIPMAHDDGDTNNGSDSEQQQEQQQEHQQEHQQEQQQEQQEEAEGQHQSLSNGHPASHDTPAINNERDQADATDKQQDPIADRGAEATTPPHEDNPEATTQPDTSTVQENPLQAQEEVQVSNEEDATNVPATPDAHPTSEASRPPQLTATDVVRDTEPSVESRPPPSPRTQGGGKPSSPTSRPPRPPPPTATTHNDTALVESPKDTQLVPYADGGEDGGVERPGLPRLSYRRQVRAAEDDVLFLQRRVQKLKAEEEHVWKKLELARQLKERAESTRLRRQKEAELRATQRQRQADLASRERARLHDERDAQRHTLFLARSKLAMERRDRSANVRAELAELSHLRHEQTLSTSAVIAEHHQMIVDMRIRAATSRAEEAHHSQRRLERLHATEANDLHRRKEDSLKVAATLLTEEAQIIHRLQQIRRETNTVLSTVPSTPSPRRPQPPSTPRVTSTPHSPPSP